MQSFGTITPIMVEALNLVQIKIDIIYTNNRIGGILKLSYSGRISICPFHTKAFDRTGKNC